MVPIRVRRLLLISAAAAFVLHTAPSRAEQNPPQGNSIQVQSAKPRDWSADIPAHLSHVEGSVTLERDRKLEPAELNAPLLAGDQIVTRRGRVEVLFADGSTIAIDDESEVEFLSDSLVKLDRGRLRIRIQKTTKELEYRVDTEAATVWIDEPGEYRVALGPNRDGEVEVDLAVYRGKAELVNDLGSTIVRAGAGSVATIGAAPSSPFAVNVAAKDEFDRWSDGARNERVGGTKSLAYLPAEVSEYSGAFDTYGSWDYYAPAGGYVWYPTVSTGWYPYWQGRWSYSNYYGWFWIGIDHWSWPTHHYGYWGYNNSRWYWAPGSYWAPAWVAWGYAPGYVGWCPLGYGGVPVVGFYSGYYNAWTVIPAYHFNHNVWVTPYVTPYNTLAPGVAAAFTTVAKAPRPVGQVLPTRDAKPLRGPVLAARNATVTTAAVPDRGKFDSARVPARSSDTTPKSVIRGGGTPPALPPRDRAGAAPTARTTAPNAAPPPVERTGGGTRTDGPAPKYARSPDVDRGAPTRSTSVDREPPPGVERQTTPRSSATANEPSHATPPTARQAPPRYDSRPDAPAQNFSAGRPAPPTSSAPPPKYSGPTSSYEPPSRPSPSGPPPSQAGPPPRNAAPPPSQAAPPPRNAAPPPSQAAPPPSQGAPPPARSAPPSQGNAGGGGRGRGGDK